MVMPILNNQIKIEHKNSEHNGTLLPFVDGKNNDFSPNIANKLKTWW